MKRALAIALFCSSACVGGKGAAPPASPPTNDTKVERAEEGLLTRALIPLAAAIELEGYRATGAIERGFLAPSARTVEPIAIAPRTCVAIVAIATATVTDLDAAIYAADGSALAEDDTTGARPVVRLCSGERRIDAYLAFYAFQGTGSFAAQRLERPLGPADALALAEVEREATASQHTAAFSDLLRGLHGRGYADDGPITEVPLVEGSAVRLARHVQAGRCYGIVVDGQSLRVRLLDAAGREVALGVGAQGPAALQYCAREDADLLIELSTQGGERSARVARLYAEQASVGSARAVWLGEPSAAFAIGARAAKESAADARCTGKALPLISTHPLTQGALTEHELELSGCVRVEAQLHAGLSVLTLRVEDSGGHVVGERELLAPHGQLHVCPTTPGKYRITAIARAGFGALSLRHQACGD
jgi:hypothetical protein